MTLDPIMVLPPDSVTYSGDELLLHPKSRAGSELFARTLDALSAKLTQQSSTTVLKNLSRQLREQGYAAYSAGFLERFISELSAVIAALTTRSKGNYALSQLFSVAWLLQQILRATTQLDLGQARCTALDALNEVQGRLDAAGRYNTLDCQFLDTLD